MKHTKKYVAALKTVKQVAPSDGGLLTDGTANGLYSALEEKGYSWDSNRGTWERFTRPKSAISTGVVDIRLRAPLGDIEQATKLIGEALEAVGCKFVRLSPPDPDDRNGPATTARVYMQVVIPHSS